MSFRAIFYAYLLGGVTFIPLVVCGLIYYSLYTSVPVGDLDAQKRAKRKLALEGVEEDPDSPPEKSEMNDTPKTRKGWLTVRRTFEESSLDGSYVTLMRNFLDARSKDPKRSRPKDTWFVVLKGKILYLYEDEGMTECEAAIQLGSHDVVIYPEDLLDGELFTKRNAICLKPKGKGGMPSVTREMKLGDLESEAVANIEQSGSGHSSKEKEKKMELEKEKLKAVRDEALDHGTPWFIFVRSTVEMEDWYHAMVHASDQPAQTPYLSPLQPIFLPSDMNLLVSTLDEQPDVIPMRWFNALFGRIFYSFYRTDNLESFIIGRIMKKISKVKRPAFLSHVAVTEVSVGNRTPVFSKPMLKELTKEGDASMEVHVQYKGEVRITVEATAIINLGARFKSYTVTLVLAVVLKEIEGNLLIKVKRPPSNRIWYAFTQMPKMVLEVEPIVSDRQITWGMILSTIESKIKEIIQESVVMPNMDDISFFESMGHDHRGGIWADSARKERATPPKTTQPGDSEDASHPELVATSDEHATNTHLNDDVSPPVPVTKAQTISEVPFTSTSEAPSVATPEEALGALNKRKTWFSSVRGPDINVIADQPKNSTDESERGRLLDSDKTQRRSQSTPGNTESSFSGELSDNGEPTEEPSERAPRRLSSRHSPVHDSTIASTSDDDNSATVYPRPPTPGSRTNSIPNAPSSPSSFLSAFKKTTADKQALSNQAKEAMKKWGVNVNWGNLRKDSGVSSSSGGSDELPDHGSVGSGLTGTRTESSTNSTGSFAQKARASYAEVRAAVAERRGKHQGQETLSSSPIGIPIPSSPSPSPSPSSSPSNRRLSNANEASTSSARRLSSATSSSWNGVDRDDATPQAISMSRSPTQNNHLDDVHRATSPPIYSVQPQAKTMSIPGIHVSHRGEVMSMGYVAPQPQPNPPSIPSSSPEGKSKVLNSLGGTAGIQSVYRLFSKGSGQQSSPERDSDQGQLTRDDQGSTPRVAEPSEAALSTVITNSTDNDTPHNSSTPPVPSTPAATKTPPPLPPRSSPALSLAKASTSTGIASPLFSPPIVSTSTSPSPPATGISPPNRPQPPPLPPRSSHIRARPSLELSRASSEISTEGLTVPGLSPPLEESQSQSSAASEKLKSIASKDDGARSKRASLTGPLKEKEKEREEPQSQVEDLTPEVAAA
ncbi:endoplasmic reticulum protein [Moniliophthora roreri MCA 2997]|uniref:Endoplasmic reticulum protein n=1 Tax=Moniliophthora roreri (strain MCA 2997) TaxID=1381753 RepID=V2XR68_MONRO|nr:endoplasmic reticulum protein [Moniliophthora roreri MCA 2997]